MSIAVMLALPLCDLDRLKRRVANFAEDRPGVYRMLAPDGRVIYVGKAKRVRARLLTYFRAVFPEDKAARILNATIAIEWDYVPSEFAAFLKELRLIKQHRPMFNVRMNRQRRATLVKLSAGPASKIFVGTTPGKKDTLHYGPLSSASRTAEAIKVLNDLLKLRDCALSMPVAYAEQGDLFASGRRAQCLRHDLGTCTGPCAGLVTEDEYQRRVSMAVNFLEGRAIAPIDHVVKEMMAASDAKNFERARWWRERFEALEWLLHAMSRARATVEALSFIYVDPGVYGDDRVYLIRRATVRAIAPAPVTPLEREAFRGVIRDHLGPERSDTPLPVDDIDEMLWLSSWFNGRPEAMRRTVPIEEWLRDDGRSAIDATV